MIAAGALVACPGCAADAAAGKAKAADSCADCRGDTGAGDRHYPAVAGTSVENFARTIEEYQNGTRTESAKMTREAKRLGAEDIANLAACCATLE